MALDDPHAQPSGSERPQAGTEAPDSRQLADAPPLTSDQLLPCGRSLSRIWESARDFTPHRRPAHRRCVLDTARDVRQQVRSAVTAHLAQHGTPDRHHLLTVTRTTVSPTQQAVVDGSPVVVTRSDDGMITGRDVAVFTRRSRSQPR
jgi:hypothetical protein